MEPSVPNEFHIHPFALHYEVISDTFLDTRGAAASLMSQLAPGERVFEIGLGTGYFASLLVAKGAEVEGIQPADELLPILKDRHPNVRIVGEAKLEDYVFDRLHSTIVSHSSVFLFTTHEVAFGRNGEARISLVLQSFVLKELVMHDCLRKVVSALAPDGRLFINIQTNPLQRAVVGEGDDQLVFEMTKCVYHMDFKRVEKWFRLSYRQRSYLVQDNRFCEPYYHFLDRLASLNCRASVTQDGMWVIISKMG